MSFCSQSKKNRMRTVKKIKAISLTEIICVTETFQDFSIKLDIEPLMHLLKITRNGSITTDSMYWPIKQCLKIRIEIQVIWQCLSLSFEETWEINIAKKEFSNTVLWVWMVLAWFCRKNEDLASSCLLSYFFRTVYISHWYMRVQRVKIKVFKKLLFDKVST